MEQGKWPDSLFDLIFVPNVNESLVALAEMAEDEPGNWEYQNTPSDRPMPILQNYIRYTYKRLAEEDKIVVSDDGQKLAFNTGLVTPGQEPIYCYAVPNRMPDNPTPWHFSGWRRKGEYQLTAFASLPEMANYYTNPVSLVYDTSKELRMNVEHIIEENRDRFPEPYRAMNSYQLQTFLKGAKDNAIERVKRNYKTAIPQYYQGRIQLLLPLCLSDPAKADLAIAVNDHGDFYRASTCLTLDMAYNNARQLARPDRDWLNP